MWLWTLPSLVFFLGLANSLKDAAMRLIGRSPFAFSFVERFLLIVLLIVLGVGTPSSA